MTDSLHSLLADVPVSAQVIRELEARERQERERNEQEQLERQRSEGNVQRMINSLATAPINLRALDVDGLRTLLSQGFGVCHSPGYPLDLIMVVPGIGLPLGSDEPPTMYYGHLEGIADSTSAASGVLRRAASRFLELPNGDAYCEFKREKASGFVGQHAYRHMSPEGHLTPFMKDARSFTFMRPRNYPRIPLAT